MLSQSALEDSLAAFFESRAASDVIAAYLFGSHAAGRPHRESDVDVAVLLDRATHADQRSRFEIRLRLTGEIGSAAKSNAVDLVVLNDVPPGLARAIITHGRRLFCRDADAERAFVRTTLLRAADLEPFLRRTRRTKLHAVGR